MSAEWFKSFTEGEASHDEDHAMHPEDSPSLLLGQPPLGVFDREHGVLPEAKEFKWFQESRSGGSAEAWQTYYPALDTVKAAGFAESQAKVPAKWTEAGDQLYVAGVEARVSDQLFSGRQKPDKLAAGWFEPSVIDLDVFGRKRAPSEGSFSSYVEWEARSSTSKLACPDAGCVATTSLQLFDPLTEEARLCSLSVSLHATDFDDAFSSEHLDWVYVNEDQVNVNCDPMESGCADASLPASERKLYPCVTDSALGEGTVATGSVNVSGKLNKMVDECPVDGNLLSGVANVTCFIRKKTQMNVTLPTAAKKTPAPSLNGTALLQCAKPGCEAVAVIKLSEAVSNKTCLLTLRVNDTDFDNTLTENIAVISVGSNSSAESSSTYRQLGNNVTSGKNPCHEAFLQGNASSGTAASFVQSSFLAVENENVSSSLVNGSLTISAKLSDMVDECGRNGFLLDAMATVTCS